MATPPTASKQLTRLTGLLKALFQLDQPELDFGLYKIMHAKSREISRFLEQDLPREVESALGSHSDTRLQAAQTTLDAAIAQARLYGAPDPEAAPVVQDARAASAQAADRSLQEADLYDHLYRFFERYYDNGDFLSRRYYARESDSRAAPYSVPYDGREVYLHWANKDQYYIKSSETLSHFSFDLTESVRQLQADASADNPNARLDGAPANNADGVAALLEPALKVHLRMAQAAEGEHGNIKTAGDQKREFIPLLAHPAEINAEGELILNFEYKVLPGGLPVDAAASKALMDQYDFSAKGDVGVHWMADVLLQAINQLNAAPVDRVSPQDVTRQPGASEANVGLRFANPTYESDESQPSPGPDTAQLAATYARLLATPAPTDKQKKRPLLAKYIAQYTARNAMDYFIHKDLGGFLRRELDFYIKNEIMRLDDIDQADAPRVEQYLGKIKLLRRIAHPLIAFMAQLEDFQKKLWLKKKFVTETQYCITLDRVPQALYPAIAANETQRQEWVRLFAIDDIAGDLAHVGYSVPLTVEFLQGNQSLLVDTALFDAAFKDLLLASLADLDAQCDGVLIHSENFQALGLMQQKYREQVKCIYIDPPYNTGGDGFAYKDSYPHASWLAMISDRLAASYQLISAKGVLFSSIDAVERNSLEKSLDEIFGRENRVEEIIWVQNTTKNQSPTYSTNHEYVEVYSKNIGKVKSSFLMFRESKPGFREVINLIEAANNNYPSINEIEEKLKSLYKTHKQNVFSDDTDAIDEWRGLYNYNRAEYRTDDGRHVEELQARSRRAKIWVWREVDTSMPQVKEDSQKSEFRDPVNPIFRFYTPLHPISGKPCPAPKRGWAWPFLPHAKQQSSFTALDSDKRIAWGDDENKIPQRKSFLHEVETNVSKSVINDYTDGEKELTDIFGKTRIFGGPKPTTLISRFIQQSGLSNEFFCDYFSGSGTSGEAIIKLNHQDGIQRKYLLVEMGEHFNTILKPRIQKAIYSKDWRDGKPIARDGISHCFKYLRLESYEDTLNNLTLKPDPAREAALRQDNPNFQRDYLLHYWLAVETQGSQSLLNIEAIRDPAAYTLRVKKPGSDAQAEQRIDLIETFNWLIGLWVTHQGAPMVFDAEFEREPDPDLPQGGDTHLLCVQLDQRPSPPQSYMQNQPLALLDTALAAIKTGYWLRLIEGYTLKVPGDHSTRQKTLVVWRKLTDDPERDNAVLETFLLHKLQTSSPDLPDMPYAVIYVNGSTTLPQPLLPGASTPVRLIEEAFHSAMWAHAQP